MRRELTETLASLSEPHKNHIDRHQTCVENHATSRSYHPIEQERNGIDAGNHGFNRPYFVNPMTAIPTIDKNRSTTIQIPSDNPHAYSLKGTIAASTNRVHTNNGTTRSQFVNTTMIHHIANTTHPSKQQNHTAQTKRTTRRLG